MLPTPSVKKWIDPVFQFLQFHNGVSRIPFFSEAAGVTFFRLRLRSCSKIFESGSWSGSGVKRNFWLLRIFCPIAVSELFCFSEQTNKV